MIDNCAYRLLGDGVQAKKYLIMFYQLQFSNVSFSMFVIVRGIFINEFSEKEF